MKTIIVTLLAISALSAQTKPADPAPPKLPDSVLVRYWHAIAAHHAQNAALQSSMTAQQKQAQEVIAATDKQIEGIRAELAASCGDKASLDETGSDPACVAKPSAK